MIEKAYGFVLRDGAAGCELLVFEHAGMPEAGVQAPGGTVEPGEAPIEAVAREVREESGLALDGWREAVSFETGGQRWHCFTTAPGVVLPDAWSYDPRGSAEEAAGLRFEYRWIPLHGGEVLAGVQEAARRAVASVSP